MSVELKIKITKDLIERSAMCGYGTNTGPINENCLFALAVRDIFPKAKVFTLYISFFGNEDSMYECANSKTATVLPSKIVQLITLFDHLNPEQRKQEISEGEYTIQVPDAVIEKINISEITELLKDHPILELKTV